MFDWNREVYLWDAIAAVMWAVGLGLIFAAAITGLEPMVPFGLFVALIASVLTVAGIVRRRTELVLSQMHRVFELGRESVAVSEIKPKR